MRDKAVIEHNRRRDAIGKMVTLTGWDYERNDVLETLIEYSPEFSGIEFPFESTAFDYLGGTFIKTPLNKDHPLGWYKFEIQ